MTENDTTHSYFAAKALSHMLPHPPLAFTGIDVERLGFAYGLLLAAKIIANLCAGLVLLTVSLVIGAVVTNWDAFVVAALVVALMSLPLALLSMTLKLIGDEIADKAVAAYARAAGLPYRSV